jgi:hypothetical protein
MFLKKLTDEEKRAFMVLASNIVLTDDQIDLFEQKVIDGFLEEMGLSTKDFDKDASNKGAVEIFRNSTNATKRAVLIELLSVCFSNDDFDEGQVKHIEEIRAGLGVSQDFVEKASVWVREILELTKAGHLLVEEL